MSTRERLRDAIGEEVEKAVAAGGAVDVDALALRLSSTYQQSGFTISEIIAEIRARVSEENYKNMRRHLS